MLLLEAGSRDNWIWFHIPVGYLFAIGKPRPDWLFRTQKEAGLNGRDLAYPRGKVIGGSSAINAMISMRGQAADDDHWRQIGLSGWDDGIPTFIAPNCLSTDDDRQVAADANRVTRRFVSQASLAPPTRCKSFCREAKVGNDDASLAKAAGDMDTARIDLESDALAVVDERLRVHGISGLRVVDASVMPSITCGNTNTPTAMIVEKGAGVIVEDAR